MVSDTRQRLKKKSCSPGRIPTSRPLGFASDRKGWISFITANLMVLTSISTGGSLRLLNLNSSTLRTLGGKPASFTSPLLITYSGTSGSMLSLKSLNGTIPTLHSLKMLDSPEILHSEIFTLGSSTSIFGMVGTS